MNTVTSRSGGQGHHDMTQHLLELLERLTRLRQLPPLDAATAQRLLITPVFQKLSAINGEYQAQFTETKQLLRAREPFKRIARIYTAERVSHQSLRLATADCLDNFVGQPKLKSFRRFLQAARDFADPNRWEGNQIEDFDPLFEFQYLLNRFNSPKKAREYCGKDCDLWVEMVESADDYLKQLSVSWRKVVIAHAKLKPIKPAR